MSFGPVSALNASILDKLNTHHAPVGQNRLYRFLSILISLLQTACWISFARLFHRK